MFSRVLANASRMTANSAIRAQTVRNMTTKATQNVKSNKKVAVAGIATAVAATAAAGFTVASAEASADYAKVREALADVCADNPAMGPTLVRLCWHSCGSYSVVDGKGGSNGAMMRFSPEKDWGNNAGLHVARNAMENIKAKHPGITYADLYTLAGVVAIEEMGGPKINWRPGRVDFADGTQGPQQDRLPNAIMGSNAETIQHVRDVFTRLGFNEKETVALIGAHAIGRCHPEASGFWGPWTRAETTFSNEYYRELLENTWTPKKWNGPSQYEDPTGDLMMLHSDMALIWDPKFKGYCEEYMKDEQKFFDDFAAAFEKLTENGCGFPPLKSGLFGLGFGPF